MEVLRSRLLSDHGFTHAFSTRLGGVSPAPFDDLNLGRTVGDDPALVAENRRRFAEVVGYEEHALFELHQVHGPAVRRIVAREDPQSVWARQADALVTRDRCALAIRTADCVPVLLAHPSSGAVGALHAGWRGAVAGVVHEAIRELAVRPEELLAAIGPHIRRDAFEIGEDVARQLAKVSPAGVSIVDRSQTKPHGDLTALVTKQLLAAGLCAENIDDVGGCTYDDSHRFFSHRRDHGKTGRHLSVIVCPC